MGSRKVHGMHSYKSVVVDKFEHALYISITQKVQCWRAVNGLAESIWPITRVIELSMNDEMMSWMPRRGTRPWC